MVKLTRMGETHQLKLVVCIEIALRHMEHMVVVEKKYLVLKFLFSQTQRILVSSREPN